MYLFYNFVFMFIFYTMLVGTLSFMFLEPQIRLYYLAAH